MPACVTFGLVGKALSLGNLEVFLLSALVYAGASQFIGAQLLVGGTAAPIILLLTLIINLRYFFISMSFSKRVSSDSRSFFKGIIGFGLTERGICDKYDVRKKPWASRESIHSLFTGIRVPTCT
ncbi:AzlC family ABC transporter permease [Paenibacillus sp. FA6]|uniref:AzlC family ABC transporter permease n=1 Tax=Paenibacillus sp. FA6 TaxID=3413029 RepID=UPI003F659581